MIRKAELKDVPQIGMLLEQIYQVHAELRPDFLKISGGRKYSDEEVRQMLDGAEKPIFVYVDNDDTVQAYLFCQIQETKGKPNMVDCKVLYIDDICVDGNYRGQGIGERLMDYAKEVAKENACSKLTLNVWNDNHSAVRFYERLGMRAFQTTMEMDV